MPVVPNVLERLLLFRLNRGPAPMLDLFGAASFEATALALDVDLFEAIEDAPGGAPPADLAATVGADERGLTTLLRFLDAQGYVDTEGDRYRNTQMTRTWLLADADRTVGPWLTFWKDLVFPFWDEYLETAVREGEPPRSFYEWVDEEPRRWDTVQAGFRAAASVTVDEVADKLTVPADATRLLDVGGGHGLYAIRLCGRHPQLRATVFDYEEALDAARREAERAGVTDRVTLRSGDYRTDDLGDGYDVALLFNVVHAHDEPENVALLERVRAAMASGGRVGVLDQFEGSTRFPVGEAALRFVTLAYLVTLGGRIYRYGTVRDWLQRAGFTAIEKAPIRRAGAGNALVQARTP